MVSEIGTDITNGDKMHVVVGLVTAHQVVNNSLISGLVVVCLLKWNEVWDSINHLYINVMLVIYINTYTLSSKECVDGILNTLPVDLASFNTDANQLVALGLVEEAGSESESLEWLHGTVSTYSKTKNAIVVGGSEAILVLNDQDRAHWVVSHVVDSWTEDGGITIEENFGHQMI